MQGRAAHSDHVAALLAFECREDGQLVAIPRPEVQLVVRFGASMAGGLDVHAMGVQQTAHRKVIRRGQRTVTARLRLGAAEAVLGVPALALAGRIVALEDLWGDAATRRLLDRIAGARDMADASAVLRAAIDERLEVTRPSGRRGSAQLAADAAERLTTTDVNAVAAELGVSERHLRRVFRETVGVSPKAFARLTRFHRALSSAREDRHTGWASIAQSAGYYDQAHLIAEFRAIAGATPRALLGELRTKER